MGKSKLDDGFVDITLNGETYQMKATIKAARLISARYEGFGSAIALVSQLRLDATTDIVKIGLGLTEREFKEMDIDNAVWRAGLPNLAGPLTRYLMMLINGGRSPSGDDDDEGEAKRDAPAGEA